MRPQSSGSGGPGRLYRQVGSIDVSTGSSGPVSAGEWGEQEPGRAWETPDGVPWTLRAGHCASAQPDLQPRCFAPGPHYEPRREGPDHQACEQRARKTEMGRYKERKIVELRAHNEGA